MLVKYNNYLLHKFNKANPTCSFSIMSKNYIFTFYNFSSATMSINFYYNNDYIIVKYYNKNYFYGGENIIKGNPLIAFDSDKLGYIVPNQKEIYHITQYFKNIHNNLQNKYMKV